MYQIEKIKFLAIGLVAAFSAFSTNSYAEVLAAPDRAPAAELPAPAEPTIIEPPSVVAPDPTPQVAAPGPVDFPNQTNDPADGPSAAPSKPPPCFFKYQNGNNQLIPPAEVARLARTKAGSRRSIHIGGDPGEGDMGDGSIERNPRLGRFFDSMEATKRQGGVTQVYLLGPGGPTGFGPGAKVSSGEMKVMQRAASGLNPPLDLRKPAHMKAWQQGRWKEHLRKQIRYFGGANPRNVKIDVFEVDNLGIKGVDLTGQKLVDFIQETQDYVRSHGLKMKIAVKNLTVAEFKLLQAKKGEGEGKISPTFLSSYGIYERDELAKSKAQIAA